MPARRTFSVNGLTYQRLSEFAEEEGRTVSGTIEDWVAEDLDSKDVPIPTVVKPLKKAKKRRKSARAKDHFTF